MGHEETALSDAEKNPLAIGMRKGLMAGFLGSLIIKVGSALVGLLISIVLARGLGVEGYGIYALAFSIVSLLSVPVQLGLPTLVVREVAHYHVGERWDLMRGVLRRADEAVLLLSLATGLAAGVLMWMFAGRVEATQLATFAWALLLIPLTALSSLRGAALRGLRHVIQSQLPDMLIRPGLLLLFAGPLLLFGGFTPPQAMALYCVAATLAYLVGTILLRRVEPSGLRAAAPRYETAAWTRSVLPLSLLSGFQMIISQTDIIMLGLLATKQEVGLYRVAASGAALVVFALTAVNLVVAPLITRLHSMAEQNGLQDVVTFSARLAIATALPVALVLIFFGSPIIAFAFGDSFRPAHVALAILCFGQIGNAAAGSVALILNMTGHERDTVKAVAIAAAINVLLNSALIPRYGMEGAAAASCIALILWNMILCRRVWVRLGIRSHAFWFGSS